MMIFSEDHMRSDKIVIIECDEHQHKKHDCACEQVRMINISQSFGAIPVYFIRWNPDSYKTTSGIEEKLNKRRKKPSRLYWKTYVMMEIGKEILSLLEI